MLKQNQEEEIKKGRGHMGLYCYQHHLLSLSP